MTKNEIQSLAAIVSTHIGVIREVGDSESEANSAREMIRHILQDFPKMRELVELDQADAETITELYGTQF